MGMKETQEAARKVVRFPNPDALFQRLDEYMAALRKEGKLGEGAIPHLILSHGFMEWGKLLRATFPCLSWRGIIVETEKFNEHEKFLYDRFFLRIAELPSLQDMTDEEKEKLKESGWEAYLED